MGIGICSNATPVFQPQKFNASTIGRHDTDEDYISQISDTWNLKRVCQRNAANYKTWSQESLKQQCDRFKYVAKHKMSKPSRKSSIKGPTFGRRFQGVLSREKEKSASSRNHEILDEIWIATREAQRKARGDNGTIPIESKRSFTLSSAEGESTDESLKVLVGEVFDVRSKRSRRKSSFPAIERARNTEDQGRSTTTFDVLRKRLL